jgi:cytochrome c nitrite reductase small subunit
VGKYAVKMENGFWHSYKFTTQDFHEPIQIRESNSAVLQRNCVHCHGDLVHGSLEIAAQNGEPRACVRCHQDVGHGAAR